MKKLLSLALLFGFVASVLAVSADAQEKKKKEKRDPEAAFKRLDKDGDGSLTLEELKGKSEGKKAEAAEKRFKAMDKDGDGKVSLEEFKNPATPKKKKKKKDA